MVRVEKIPVSSSIIKILNIFTNCKNCCTNAMNYRWLLNVRSIMFGFLYILSLSQMDRYSLFFSLNQVLIQLLLAWTLTVIISSLVGTLPLLRWELGTTYDTSRLFDAIIIKYFYIYTHIKFDNWRRDLNLNILLEMLGSIN